jgi:secreted PhoX family phosphatase
MIAQARIIALRIDNAVVSFCLGGGPMGPDGHRPLSRRRFLAGSLAVAGGVLAAPTLADVIDAYLLRGARSTMGRSVQQDVGYGPLAPSADCPELALPAGFRCRRISEAGVLMADGRRTPGAQDGMAAFPLANGNIRLIRNHEVRPESAAVPVQGERPYDPHGGGGTTSLEVRPDGERELVRAFVSLSGTVGNCAGGPTPWGSWLSCEETTIGSAAGLARAHGYAFEVPAAAESEGDAIPLVALGRFVREAIAVDPDTGALYQTEDRLTAGLYRFLPSQPGLLQAGGQLQMLAIRGQPGYDTRRGQTRGAELPVAWVDIAEPNPPDAEANALAVFQQGATAGGAVFSRLEGIWYGDGQVYFTSTDGGNLGKGQVWAYRPQDEATGVLTLLSESTDAALLNNPDNVCVSPRGGVLLCEDSTGFDDGNYLRALDREGRLFDFAQHRASRSELAGATFSPDGQTLFVNVFSPGATYAIWGPWDRGPL